ncbi:MAG: hypothetical protein V7K88_03445 [Nostoc sp.]
MAEQTIADHDNTFSLRPNYPGGCYNTRILLNMATYLACKSAQLQPFLS